ncbi:MAG: sigma-54-dependent Fis family transcriptional regulator [Bacteroidales bacterium]|nr:sigma-54-dependent Fis family transcriptional regulator [Bacteroidales bacterium]
MDYQELQRIKNKYDIVGADPALDRAIEMAVAVAPTDLTVLVSGESGVGKENIPKIIHQNSRRRNGKYFAVNCGAIPEGTIESELFGHEKGAYTGAIEARKGYFEEADGGTLFLDEIGELPLPYQAKLLRVLQSGEYTRVGSSKVSKTDVRVVAASNVDLAYAVSQGKFREDLFYRLNAVQISMPALRDRGEDIHLLFRKFCADFSEKYGTPRITLSPDAVNLLLSYRWPGNIRQLKNIAETVSALESYDAKGSRKEIGAAVLAQYIPKDGPSMLPVAAQRQGGSMSDADKQEIFKALYGLNAEVARLRNIVEGLTASAPVNTRTETARIAEGSNEVDIQDEPDEQQGATEDNFSITAANEDLIRKALEKHGGNRKKAAEELGISERTLYRKLPPEFRTQRTK